MKRTLQLIAALSLAAIGTLSQAQTPVAPAPVAATPATPKVDAREANQQARIAQGAATGSLTAKETQHLEKEQAKINTAEANAKADGKVTKKERRHLAKMQDKASKDIHKDKTNAKTAG